MNKKRAAVFAITFVFNLLSLSALDFVFKLEPTVLLPNVIDPKWSVAPGVTVQGDFDFLNFLTVGVEGGYAYEQAKATEDGINTVFGGLNVGFYYYPISRLYLGAGGSFGIHNITTQIPVAGSENSTTKKVFNGLYYRGFGEVGFRVNPSLSVNLAGGWASFGSGTALGNAFLSGPFAAISLRMNGHFGANAKSSAIDVRITQDADVFPVYSTVYGYEPFGTIYIKNDEGAELRNVHVSFRAGKYSSSAKLCGSVDKINRHARMEFPLLADFSDEILGFTEDGKISGEIIVEYEFLGKKMSVTEPVIVSVCNRNAFIWGDSASLAAFISPDATEIATFAKEVAGITRNNIYTGMNANLQYAIGIIEGLRLIGMGYSEDYVTPYSSYHFTYDMDSIQYPLQTLQCLSGDYDELGILVCSCLQNINVPTGYIPYDDDFIVLVKLNIAANQALNNFASTDGLVIDYDTDEVYLALSMKALDKGFTASYKAGSETVAKIFSSEDAYYDFVDTTDAWTEYKPVAFSTNSSVTTPKQDALVKNIKSAIQDYISSDIEEVIKRARNSGDSNKLGVALVRAGRYSEAKREFQKAADKGSISAMNNVANILMIEKNYSAAAAQYKAILQKDPSNAAAKKGLENANSKIE
ncbi:MAG: hypothetical protein IKX70_03470 [Treponema sp.]|nr:hypothetical protein [Treponema sp.]MBR5032702.1 hypothetical protein [Treponema sp.]